MYISLSVYPGGTIEDAADKPDVVSKKTEGIEDIVWKKNAKAGKVITITQNVRFKRPGDYSLVARIVLPNVVVSDGVLFRITEDGGMEFLSDTPIPPPVTPYPLFTGTPGPTPTFLPTETLRVLPSPTAPMVPTLTPTATPTVTLPAYP